MLYLRSIILSILTLAVMSFGPASAQNLIGTYAGANRLFTADGQAATGLFLSKVDTVTLDSAGNPIIALPYRNVVIRVNSNGTLTRLAGTGEAGATGGALNAPQAAVYDAAGNLYIADTANNRIQKVSADGKISTFAGSPAGDPGFAADKLYLPTAVLVDKSNNIYINDEGNASIRKINAQGVISTYAGTSTKIPLVDPGGIALDSAGNLYLRTSADTV